MTSGKMKGGVITKIGAWRRFDMTMVMRFGTLFRVLFVSYTTT